MSELRFEWSAWKLPLHATTRIVRAFGRRDAYGGVEPLDLHGTSWALTFGRDRAMEGSPTLTLTSGDGDIATDTLGQLTLLFRPERLTALAHNTTYFCDLLMTAAGATSLFARGQIVTLGKVVA